MSGIVEIGLLVFGSVGLVVLCHWVLRSGWSLLWKGVAFVVAAFLAQAFWKMPLNGQWGNNHGPLLDLFAIVGIVVSAVYIIRHRRFRRDWRPQAGAAIVALVLVALIIGARTNHRGQMSRPAPSAPHVAVSPPRRQRSTRRAPSTGGSTRPPCDELSYAGKLRNGCPP